MNLWKTIGLLVILAGLGFGILIWQTTGSDKSGKSGAAKSAKQTSKPKSPYEGTTIPIPKKKDPAFPETPKPYPSLEHQLNFEQSED